MVIGAAATLCRFLARLMVQTLEKMQMKKALLVILMGVAFLMSGCTTSGFKKVEVYEKQPGTPFVKDSNYLVLARYWDDHANKQMSYFHGAAFLNVLQEEGRAEITIGNGPYYGMIELKNIDGRSTLITTYAWDYLAKKVFEWEELLRGYTPPKK